MLMCRPLSHTLQVHQFSRGRQWSLLVIKTAALEAEDDAACISLHSGFHIRMAGGRHRPRITPGIIFPHQLCPLLSSSESEGAIVFTKGSSLHIWVL